MFDVIPACAEVSILDRDRAKIVVAPPRKKVALVGFATNTLHLVPWDNPEFEVWGMNQGYMHMLRRADRWFEMHQHEATADVRDPGYLEWLANCPIPIYMIQTHDNIPHSVRFPIEDAVTWLGRDYFMSTVAYMMAIAGMEGFEEVHLYGINLAIGEEYTFEKPNAEYMIGRLESMGVKVYIPSASALLKQQRRYGYAIDARPAQSLKGLLNARIGEYTKRIEQMSAELHVIVGAKKESEALIQIMEGVDHGADIVMVPQTPLKVTPPVESTNGSTSS